MTKTPAWLKTYVREIQVRLGRGETDIRIGEHHSDEGTYAQVNPHEQAAEAEIRFSPDFYSDTPQGQRNTVVHEVLHLHFVGVDDVVHAWVDKLAPVDYAMLKRMMVRQEERIVDFMARIISPFMPLPPKRKKRERR
jgi:hypothetical protein